jgi:hypothetical protein
MKTCLDPAVLHAKVGMRRVLMVYGDLVQPSNLSLKYATDLITIAMVLWMKV